MTSASGDLPAATRIGHVALRVNDLDRMVEFYRDVLGLAVRHRGDDRAVLGTETEPLLELHSDSNAPDRAPDETGLFHVAFRVPSRDALADALQRVREHWRLDGASDHLVSEALYLSDPEGNGIEIYRDRPQEEWPTNPDGTVEMKTLRLDVDELADRGSGGSTVPEETTVGHVHLEVSSLQTAREFYVDTLGMTVRQRYGDSALFVAAGDYHHHVGLNVWNTRSAPPTGRGLEWFEVVVPDRQAIDAVKARFVERDIEFTLADGTLTTADPDGIELRVRVTE